MAMYLRWLNMRHNIGHAARGRKTWLWEKAIFGLLGTSYS